VTIKGRLQGGSAFSLVIVFTPGLGQVKELILFVNGAVIFDQKVDPNAGAGSGVVQIVRENCDPR
jgi:hypothetical protein